MPSRLDVRRPESIGLEWTPLTYNQQHGTDLQLRQFAVAIHIATTFRAAVARPIGNGVATVSGAKFNLNSSLRTLSVKPQGKSEASAQGTWF